MKKIYLTLFPLILLLFIFIGLMFVNIPSPSKLIKEEYNLSIK